MEIWRRAVDATHDFLAPGDRRAIEAEVAAFLPQAALDLAVDATDRPLGLMLLEGKHLAALFVDPAHHAAGIGRMLVEEALRRCPDRMTDNVRALGFYERLGFTRIGRAPRDGQGRPYPLIHLRFVR